VATAPRRSNYERCCKDVRPKPFSSHPVEQPEVNRLGQLAVVLANIFPTGKASGRKSVEVAAFGVGGEPLPITRDLGSLPCTAEPLVLP
jgi:hypothetical protein